MLCILAGYIKFETRPGHDTQIFIGQSCHNTHFEYNSKLTLQVDYDKILKINGYLQIFMLFCISDFSQYIFAVELNWASWFCLQAKA